jgi:single-strand DNA-binding protein
MATTRYVPQNEGAPREETTWHTVESWGRLAMLVRDHLRKGRQVFVRGRLELQEWDHKTDRIASTGKPVRCSRTVVVADEIVFGAGERVAQQGGQNDHAR